MLLVILYDFKNGKEENPLFVTGLTGLKKWERPCCKSRNLVGLREKQTDKEEAAIAIAAREYNNKGSLGSSTDQPTWIRVAP